MSMFKKTLSELGQFAVEKKNQVVQTSQTKSVLEAEKEKLASAYTALGDAYFQLRHSNPDPELAAYVATIEASLLAIEECNRQIRLAEQGGPVCANCGAKLAPGAVFCNQCGASADSSQAGGGRPAVCPQCGNPVSPDAAFCGECGCRLGATLPPQGQTMEVDAQPDAAQASTLQAVDQQSALQPNTCPYCGTEVDSTSQVCPTCASPLS